MVQRRLLRSREVTFSRQSQRKLWCGRAREESRPGWPALDQPRLPTISLRHWPWAHSSPVVLLLPTSGWLLTHVLSFLPWPLENLYFVTHPLKWQWMLMKMIMEEDERKFSGAWAWRHRPPLCLLPQESDFNGRNVSGVEGKVVDAQTMVAMLYGDQSLKHLCLSQQPLALPVERGLV